MTPLGYDLRLELDPEADTFRGKVAIEVRIDAPMDHVWIHADELELAAASFRDGDHRAPLLPLATAGDQMRGFGFGARIDHRTVTLDFEFTGHADHDEEGLFRQREGDHWYLFSQAESVFARRITPCFDEPRFKVPWHVTLVIPAGQRGFGNMPVAHETDLPDGRHEVAFADTPPMASYLLAVAVGPFDVVDAGVVGTHRVPVRVAALHGDRERVGVVAARLPAIVDAIEKYTGDLLPWPKLDLVAVPHLFGAMENLGLITFDAPVLVGDPKQRGFNTYFTRIRGARDRASMVWQSRDAGVVGRSVALGGVRELARRSHHGADRRARSTGAPEGADPRARARGRRRALGAAVATRGRAQRRSG